MPFRHKAQPAGGIDLVVVDKDDQRLGFVDLERSCEWGTVQLSGRTGHEVAVDRDRALAYVPIYSDVGVGQAGSDGRSIDVVDLRAGSLLRTIDLGKPVRPHGIVVGGDGLLYVTAELTDEILVLDADAFDVVGTIPTGAEQSHMVALSADLTVACTSNVGAGSISVLDLASRTVRGVVPVSSRVNRIALSPDGRLAYASDQTSPRVAVVDTRDLVVREWIRLPAPGFGSALTPDGQIVVALRGVDAVAVVRLADPSDVRVIDVPSGPQAVVLDDAGRRAYTACHPAEAVVEIDLQTCEVSAVVPVGRNPDGICRLGS